MRRLLQEDGVHEQSGVAVLTVSRVWNEYLKQKLLAPYGVEVRASPTGQRDAGEWCGHVGGAHSGASQLRKTTATLKMRYCKQAGSVLVLCGGRGLHNLYRGCQILSLLVQ